MLAAGALSSLPHYETGRVPLGRGLVLLDYGCVVDGYHSDMSRTIWLEGALDPVMERGHGGAWGSQRAGGGSGATGGPGFYLRGVGGVRIEDMVLVTEDGPVVLTGSARELVCR